VTGTLALFLTESPEPVTAQVIKTALVNIASHTSRPTPQHQRCALTIQACHRRWAPDRRREVAVVTATRHDSNTAG
jgi:hypothetical protein